MERWSSSPHITRAVPDGFETIILHFGQWGQCYNKIMISYSLTILRAEVALVRATTVLAQKDCVSHWEMFWAPLAFSDDRVSAPCSWDVFSSLLEAVAASKRSYHSYFSHLNRLRSPILFLLLFLTHTMYFMSTSIYYCTFSITSTFTHFPIPSSRLPILPIKLIWKWYIHWNICQMRWQNTIFLATYNN